MANEIRARITADATGFSGGLQKAQRSIDGFAEKTTKRFAGLNRSIAAFGGLAVLGAAATSFDRAAKAALALGGAIDDAAKTAGIGAEALQEYRFAAKQSGIEVEQLDKAIATFVRNLGEARRGNKEFAETFTQIGVTARDTNERALQKSFEFLAGITDRAQRASVAAELFGARAQRMATLVEGGAEGLKAMIKQARDLGIVLSNELVAAADEVGDRLDRLDQQLNAKLNRSILANIDGFEDFKVLMNDAARFALFLAVNIGKAADALDDFFERLPGTKIDAGTDLENLIVRRTTLEKQTDALLKQAAGARDAAKKLDGVPLLESLSDRQLGFLDDRLKQNALQLLRLDEVIKARRATASAPAIDPIGGDDGGGGPAAFANPFPGLDAPLLKSDAVAKNLEAAQKRIDEIAASFKTPLDQIREQMEEIATLKPFAENAEQASVLERAAEALKKQFKELKISTSQWGAALTEVQRGLADSFAAAIVRGENLGGLLKRLTAQLAERALSDFLFKSLGSAFKIGIPGLAAGGPVFAGRSYIVGEQGPEVFTPSVSGAIIPNGDLSGGGVTVVQNIRFDVGLESVDQRIGQLTPSISGAVVEAVQRAQSRPRYA